MRDPGFEVDLVVHGEVSALARVHTGHLSFADALRAGTIKVEGPRPLAQEFPRWLLHSPFAQALKPAHAG
jgi:hypothetical protein